MAFNQFHYTGELVDGVNGFVAANGVDSCKDVQNRAVRLQSLSRTIPSIDCAVLKYASTSKCHADTTRVLN